MLLGNRLLNERQQMANLTKKYDTTAFMYTEYPHKNFWSKEMGDPEFRKALKALFSKDKNVPLMLYVHIPYCEQLCWFCTCHMSITKEYEKVRNYLDFLFREIDLHRELFRQLGIKPNFREIHLGGGSPTFVNQKDFDQLVEKLAFIADLKNLDEFAIEIDPRRVDRDRMKYYHSKGINRISFGVQDFDLEVQKAVNRVQPAELIENLLTPEIRKRFSNGVNFDLICGLPNQTTQTIRETCERAARMSPDRICLNYLHYSPKFAPHQTIMIDGRNGRPTQLPDFHERKLLFLEALDALTQQGYVRTGYDHFAKPTDAVAKSMKKRKMQWNELGVTAGRYVDILGIGVFSMSTLGEYYFQNVYEIPDYEAAVSKGHFPTYRGHQLTQDDLIRRGVIHSLRNFFSVEFQEIEERYSIRFREYSKREIASLGEFVKDGVVEVLKNSILITELGHQFTNLVCRNFDKYYEGNKLIADLGELTQDKAALPEASSEIKKAVKTS